MSSQVNRPTNVKVKEEDVNRKLQLYGIFAAFQAGKVPSVSHDVSGKGIQSLMSPRTSKLISLSTAS
jgi:hypothetical protein